ncbi:cyclophilin-like fold protein [Kluyvera ascorbata]|uniref:cyclophilin-like fold protein n=1 Tax=Kluyvera ascorbata TaxID=51288 RepID=UPI00289B692D|nr:cyclophilin-like fold protein [Kluyvera ascorbata]
MKQNNRVSLSPAYLFAWLVALSLFFSGPAQSQMTEKAVVTSNRTQTMTAPTKINIAIGGQNVRVALDDTPSARAFIARLPLTVRFEDYGSTEKISYLPRKLTTEGEPAGYTPVAGDFSYYAPWGNIAVFLKDFRYSQGLIRLGHIESGLQVMKQEGEHEGIITLLDD